MKLGLGCRLGALFAVLRGALSIGAARANVIFVTNAFNNTIGEYNATTGAVVNAALVSGLDGPAGPASSRDVAMEPVHAAARSSDRPA